jgi:hypothetical protein
MFAFSYNTEKTAEYVESVIDTFQRNNVPVLYLGKLMTDIEPNDWVIVATTATPVRWSTRS